MQAIQTVYRGYRFRSRLEARWAVFFDRLGYEWEYESEGYELREETLTGDVTTLRWLPDFRLKNRAFRLEGDLITGDIGPKILAEVKGSEEALIAEREALGRVVDFKVLPAALCVNLR